MENSVSIPGYSQLKQLGKGAFGVVYRGTDVTSGEKRALKVLHLGTSAKKEIYVLSKLPQHPHIIEYERSIILADGSTCLVMEYCSGGNLNDYRCTHRREPSRDLRFMREIASAVAFLHRNRVVHYDLKPDNILLTDNETLKVADFGISKLASESQQGGSLYNYYTNDNYGHKYFCAPELFEGRSTERADVFQMGVIFACLLQERKTVPSGQSIIVGVFVDGMGVGQALHEGKLQRYKLPERLDISQDLRALVERMLDKNRRARPTADRVEESIQDIEEWPSPFSMEHEESANRSMTITDNPVGGGLDLLTLVERMLDNNQRARPTANRVEESHQDIEDWPSPFSQEHEESANRSMTITDNPVGGGVAGYILGGLCVVAAAGAGLLLSIVAGHDRESPTQRRRGQPYNTSNSVERHDSDQEA